MSGQVVIVTGAGRGIGRAIALAFGQTGARVVAVSRTLTQIEATVEQLRAEGAVGLAVACDITRGDDVDRMVERVLAEFGTIDTLVNNAGVMISGSVLDASEDDWDTVVNTNLKGAFLCTQRVGRVLAAQGHGKVINIGSTFGTVPVRGHGAYCASKAAIVRLTEVAALEFAPFGVQVNTVAPGYVNTELNEEILAEGGNLERVLRRVPLKRILDADELAPVVVFMASPAADYITGETLHIDGGYKLT